MIRTRNQVPYNGFKAGIFHLGSELKVPSILA